MSSISIILNYGIYVSPNPGYQVYLDAALAKSLATNLDYLVLTGGVTNHDYPDLSEAGSVKNYYLETHPELEPKILLSDTTYTTPQNLENSLDMLKQLNISVDNLNVFSDSIRSPKAFYLSLSLLYPDLSAKDKLELFFNTLTVSQIDITLETNLVYEKLTVVGIPLSDTMKMAADQIVSSMLDMHFLEYPDLQDQFIAWRKTIWGVK